MASCVSVEEIKLFLRVDHSAEDVLIESLGAAATSLVETRIRREVIGDSDTAVAKSIDDVPQAIRMAVCVIASFMYENRTATDEELRSRVLRQALLDQYIDWEA